MLEFIWILDAFDIGLRFLSRFIVVFKVAELAFAFSIVLAVMMFAGPCSFVTSQTMIAVVTHVFSVVFPC